MTPRPRRGLSLRWRWAIVTATLVTVTGAVAITMSTVVTDRLLMSRSRAAIATSTTQPATGPPPTVAPGIPAPPPAPAPPGDLAAPTGKAVADAVIHDVRIWGAGLVAVLALLSIAVAWWVSKRMLRPLQQVTTAAHAVTEAGAGQRIALSGPADELQDLADTIDGMLDRLDASSASQRNFVADASHELRTPLATMAVEIDVALDDRDATAEELRDALVGVRGTLRRSHELVESLLVLARAGGTLRHDAVDLRECADDAIDHTRILRPDVRFEGTRTPARVSGDPALIRRGVANLVDNAVRYGDPAAPIAVDVLATDAAAVVRVSSAGATVTDVEIERWFGRFARAEGARTTSDSGAGLGLAIVRQIADAHGAKISARPRPGGGLTIEIRFPHRVSDPIATA